LNLISSLGSGGNNNVAFTDQPVPRAVSDSAANELASDYFTGFISVSGLPSLNITLAGTNVILAWPVWAAAFHLQSAGNLPGSNSWNNVVISTQTNGGNINLTLPMSDTKWFRLIYP
jgi:hypothetical protein